MKRLLSALIALSLAVTLVGCGGGGSSSSQNVEVTGPSDPDTLTVGVYTDPIDLNPTNQNDQFSQMIKSQMYETLVTMDAEGNLQPNLATEWAYTDDYTLEIKLRQGVQFHTGGEMKASDVIFSLKLMSESSFANLATGHIDLEQTTAVDDYTVRIVMTDPFAAQINYFNWPLTAIVSEEGYNQINGDYSSQSIGTGPYQLVSYVKDSEVKMVGFDNYWEEGKPYIKNLNFRVIPEGTTRTLELESGGIDVATTLNIMDVDRLESSAATAVLKEPSYQMFYLFFNLDNEYLSDYNVRRAICMAVDWENAVPAAFGDSGVFEPAYVAEGVEGYIRMDPLPYDPEAAKQLLTDAGYSDGEITIEMITSNMEARVRLCEMIQASLGQIGINMEMTQMETSAFYNAYLGSEHDITMLGYFAMTGEAGKVLPYFQSDNIFNATMNWTNPEFDQLVSEAVTTIDTDTRVSLYEQAQQMIYDELVAYPILQNVLLVGTRSYVKGLELDPSFECHKFKNVYFEE